MAQIGVKSLTAIRARQAGIQPTLPRSFLYKNFHNYLKNNFDSTINNISAF